jgi:copper chaperone NosL
MGGDPDWSQTSPGPWIAADDAWFVIGSARRGGMGAPEAVPFASDAAARTFAAANGGEIVRLDSVPDAYVLGPTDIGAESAEPAPSAHGGHPGG